MIISIGIYSINRPEAGYGWGGAYIYIYVYMYMHVTLQIGSLKILSAVCGARRCGLHSAAAALFAVDKHQRGLEPRCSGALTPEEVM